MRLAAAGGTADPENPFGTDAFKVLQAIESVYSDDGVLVLMDLGSAVLSAETALELLAEDKRARVRLCAAPLVEGAVAAATLAAAGAGLEEMFREAQEALAAKSAQLGVAPQSPCRCTRRQPLAERLVTLVNPLGLHARPAAQLVRLARRFQARPTIENTTQHGRPGRSRRHQRSARPGSAARARAEAAGRGPDAHWRSTSLAPSSNQAAARATAARRRRVSAPVAAGTGSTRGHPGLGGHRHRAPGPVPPAGLSGDHQVRGRSRGRVGAAGRRHRGREGGDPGALPVGAEARRARPRPASSMRRCSFWKTRS